MANLEIVAVSNRRHWRDFYKVRRQIYKNDPAAVIPLVRMERQQLDRDHNPFFQHAVMEAFVAYDGKRPVGRIAAIFDHLHQEYHQDKTGFFGFFEAIDDQRVVQRLIDRATEWLKQQQCDLIRGPVNPSMKSDFGVLVEGHQDPPSIMLAHTPLRYERHLLDAGFEVAKSFHAFRVIFSQQFDESMVKIRLLEQSTEKVIQRYPKLKIRPVSAESYAETLRQINELGNEVRREGWGFVPLTSAELEFMIKNLRQIIRFDMIHAAYYDDRLVGYIVNIPDLNWALKRTWGKSDWLRMLQLPFLLRRVPKTRVIALGVDPDFRSKGTAMLLIKQLSDRYHFYDEWEFSWVQEDNQKSIRAISRAIPLNQFKTWRIYQRKIES